MKTIINFVFNDVFFWIHGLFVLAAFLSTMAMVDVPTLYFILGLGTLISFLSLYLPVDFAGGCILSAACRFRLNPFKLNKYYHTMWPTLILYLNLIITTLFWYVTGMEVLT